MHTKYAIMGNVKVLICTHKEVRLPRHPYFLPVQAGAALRGRIAGYQPDDEGDNISAKNAHFCELTCHYWAWKNLRGADIVGLNHYRRYFDWERGWPCADKRFVAVDDFLGRDYEFPDVEQLLDKYDMVLPVQRHWRVSNTRQYADYHNESDWEMLRQIIMERSPKYMATFERTMDYSNRGS